MTTHTILFLAANPLETDRRALDREARAIQVELERSGRRDCFELATRWAVEPLDLLRELRALRPTVVHFSGHGVVGETRGHGLFFQGPDGRAQFVSAAALTQAFGAAGSSVRLVVLSACYSEVQAAALVAHVDCVPGSGKSTFLNHLLLCLAAHGLDPEHGWLDRLPRWPADEADLVPIPVLLRDFARSLPRERADSGANPLLLWRFLEMRLADQKLEAAGAALHDALDSGRAILLLDGLDEVPTSEERRRVRAIVDAIARRYPAARLLVTCRTLSYQDPAWQLDGLPSAELAPFDEPRIERFIAAWYAELRRMGIVRPDEAGPLALALREAVHRKDLWRLAPNPLLLTVMALIHTHKGRLPDARARLYEDTVDLLLWRWDELRTSGAGEELGLRKLLRDANCQDVDLHRALWQLAYEAHTQADAGESETVADIAEHRLEAALAQLHPRKSREVPSAHRLAGALVQMETRWWSPEVAFVIFVVEAMSLMNHREPVHLHAALRRVYDWVYDRFFGYVRAVTRSDPAERILKMQWAAELWAEELWAEPMDRPDRLQAGLRQVYRRLHEYGGAPSAEPDLAERIFKELWAEPMDRPDRLQAGLRRACLRLHGYGWAPSAEPDLVERIFKELLAEPMERAIFIARYPVTEAQFDAYLAHVGRTPARSARRGKNYPVVDVSFPDALDYCMARAPACGRPESSAVTALARRLATAAVQPGRLGENAVRRVARLAVPVGQRGARLGVVLRYGCDRPGRRVSRCAHRRRGRRSHRQRLGVHARSRRSHELRRRGDRA